MASLVAGGEIAAARGDGPDRPYLSGMLTNTLTLYYATTTRNLTCIEQFNF